jgi:hypothetical protein
MRCFKRSVDLWRLPARKILSKLRCVISRGLRFAKTKIAWIRDKLDVQ